jgi:DNA mismatch endonuclease (patch repair protein)
LRRDRLHECARDSYALRAVLGCDVRDAVSHPAQQLFADAGSTRVCVMRTRQARSVSDIERRTVDRVDRATRSRIMASVRSTGSQCELLVRRALHAGGLRFRLHQRNLPGTPDIVLPRSKTVVFVNGCFWHQHKGCARATMPATRPEFWRAKLERNVGRDREVQLALRATGWTVLVVWECQTGSRHLEELVRRLRRASGSSPVRRDENRLR